MTEEIRPAAAQDLDGIAEPAALRRGEYSRYQPVFLATRTRSTSSR